MHSDIDTGGRRIHPDRAIMRPDMREAAFGFNEIESSSTTYSDGGELPLNMKRSERRDRYRVPRMQSYFIATVMTAVHLVRVISSIKRKKGEAIRTSYQLKQPCWIRFLRGGNVQQAASHGSTPNLSNIALQTERNDSLLIRTRSCQQKDNAPKSNYESVIPFSPADNFCHRDRTSFIMIEDTLVRFDSIRCIYNA